MSLIKVDRIADLLGDNDITVQNIKMTIEGVGARTDSLSQMYADLGYTEIRTPYGAGVSFTSHLQVIKVDNEFWKLDTDVTLPYTTTGAGMPESGAFICAFINTGSTGSTGGTVTDGTLRQDLLTRGGPITADSSIVEYIPALAEMKTMPVSERLSYIDGKSKVTTGTDAQKGANVRSWRDARNVVGGQPGFVNPGIYNLTSSGAQEDSFEWGILGVLENYSVNGENVAIYGQGNKLAVGPTWAGVFEARDKTGVSNPTKGLVGIEVDTFGNSTDANNLRIGIDIVVGKHSSVGPQMETGYGVRVGAQDGNLQNGRVKVGYSVSDIEFDVGLDLANGTQAPNGVGIRLAAFQKISFSSANNRVLFYADSALQYLSAGIQRFVVFDTGETNQTGDMLINGQKVITSARVGYTYGMTGTANRGTLYNTTSITLQQLAERVKALQDDLLAHGLIRE